MKAYAKVNLYLKVLNKLDNNYHRLEMLNTKIDFYDELYITDSSDKKNHVIFDNLIMPIADKDNLIMKAIEEIEKIRRINKVTIQVKKNIFQGGGLAGGSTDAACTIKLLDRFFKLDLSPEEIKKVCLSLGTDVYYCYYDFVAMVTGIGDSVKKVPKRNFYILLVNCGINSNTSKVFKNLKLNGKISEIDSFYQAYLSKDIKKMNELFVNDLEEAALETNPDLRQFKQNLMKVDDFKLSGSGSTYYILANDYEYLKAVDKKLSKFNYDTLITRTI